MKNFKLLSVLLCLCPPLVFSQTKPQVVQQAGDCSVNIAGNNTTASLTCNAIDPKLAEQIRAIVNGTHRNENALKGMSEKLDRIIKQMDLESIPPVVALRFVYAKSPALELINESDAIAKDMKWTVLLWNMDSTDHSTPAVPLQIPIGSFDWLRPHDKSGPLALFDTPLRAGLLKPGDRLAGTASVICPTCARGRSYVVFIVWGEGGWISEIESAQSGNVFMPSNKMTLAEFYKLLDAVPPQSRKPIAEDP